MTRAALLGREVVRDDLGVIGTRAVLHVHVFDPSYRGSAETARCVICGGRRAAPQHKLSPTPSTSDRRTA